MKSLFFRSMAILMLLLCSQVIYGVLHPTQTEMSLDASADLSPVSSIVSFGIYAVVSFSLLFYLHSLPEMLRSAKLVLCLPLLAVLSVAWSQDPELTLRRAIVLLVVSTIGACLGAIYSMQELSKLITITGFLICVATFLLAPIAPGFVRDSVNNGAWKGLFTHKNAQGVFMALAFLSAVHSEFVRHRWFKYATVFLTGVLLLLSRSSTSLLAVIVSFAFLPLWKLTRVPVRQVVFALASFTLVIGAAAFTLSHYSVELAGIFGKDTTLTGRTELWAMILQSIARRPLLGYGYNAFWLGMKGESLSIIAASGWVVYHAHNGLLDVLLGLGAVGGILFLFTYVKLVGMIVSHTRSSGATLGELWPASFLVLLTVINCTESLLLSANTIFWLLYVAIYANIARRAAFKVSAQSAAPLLSEMAQMTPQRL